MGQEKIIAKEAQGRSEMIKGEDESFPFVLGARTVTVQCPGRRNRETSKFDA